MSTAALANAVLPPELPTASSDDEARMAWADFVSADDKFEAGPATVAALERIIEQDPECASAHYFVGQVFLFVGDELNARVWFSKTLKIDPTHAAARQRLAAMGS
jgi:predicted TPR repeat methyltransferase